MIELLAWPWAGALIALLWAAAIKDVRTFTIPHAYTYGALLLLIPVTLLAVGEGLEVAQIPVQALGGLIAFMVGFVMFALRVMGGGDVKLLAAVTPMIAFGQLLTFFVMISIAGLVWAVAYAFYLMVRDRNQFESWKTSYQSVRKSRVPYGPAIAAGATTYFCLPHLIA